MKLRTLDGLSLKGRKVLVRVDFNVPMKNREVKDVTRIKAHLETISLLKEAGAAITLVSHLGRPKGKHVDDLSLKPVAEVLRNMTGWEVDFIGECTGSKVSDHVSSMNAGQILLLENIRFCPEEETNEDSFSKTLAEPFDLFVMDAFSASHRAHASTEGVTRYLRSFAGKVMEREVGILGSIIESPKEPLVLIMGGAKVSDKINFFRFMIEKANIFLVGGAMAFPFLKASGYEVGSSFCEEGTEEIACNILKYVRMAGKKILLPSDVVVSDSISNASGSRVVKLGNIPEDLMGLDIGPETTANFISALKGAETILWNGPMGVFETDPFGEGTRHIGEAVCRRTEQGALTVIGGGDTAAAANVLGFSGGVSHVSTGGGATLEFFEGTVLPGIKPLLESR